MKNKLRHNQNLFDVINTYLSIRDKCNFTLMSGFGYVIYGIISINALHGDTLHLRSNNVEMDIALDQASYHEVHESYIVLSFKNGTILFLDQD